MVKASQITSELTEDQEERLDRLKGMDLYDRALERYIESRDLDIETKSQNLEFEIVKNLSEEQFEELIRQFKYAGRQTINYFVISGLGSSSLEELREEAIETFANQEEVENVSKRPFVADTEIIDDRLYASIGYYVNVGGRNPLTGKKKEELTTSRAVLVIWEEKDLIEVRCTDGTIATRIKDKVAEMQGLKSEENAYKPNFGSKFQENFNELVDKYTNLKVRLDDKEGSTIDTIQFTSKTDETGSKKDTREDDRVTKELEEHGGEITMGYVEVSELSSFHINRKQSKIAIGKCEREEKLNQITQMIHNVLKESGGYPQRKLQDI